MAIAVHVGVTHLTLVTLVKLTAVMHISVGLR